MSDLIVLGKRSPAERIRMRQGIKIRQIRKLREYSVVEFANLLDVTEGAVRQWETGRYTPRQAMQVRIADKLGVPWSVIFSIDGEVA